MNEAIKPAEVDPFHDVYEAMGDIALGDDVEVLPVDFDQAFGDVVGMEDAADDYYDVTTEPNQREDVESFSETRGQF
jgi:hypothetical protein